MCVKIMYFEGNVVPKLRKIINFGTTFSVCVCEREREREEVGIPPNGGIPDLRGPSNKV